MVPAWVELEIPPRGVARLARALPRGDRRLADHQAGALGNLAMCRVRNAAWNKA